LNIKTKGHATKMLTLKNAIVFDVIKRRTFHKYDISFCWIVVSNIFFSLHPCLHPNEAFALSNWCTSIAMLHSNSLANHGG
jgi:hypothetical protein